MKTLEQLVNEIRTLADFVDFTEYLAQNNERWPAEWENSTIRTYLDGFIGYLEDSDDELNWQSLARGLFWARTYE